MIHSILSTIVCVEFEKNFRGRFEERAESPKAMIVSFGSRINHDVEDGYRYLDLMIYAPTNYVLVCSRERWNIISLEDLTDDNNPKIKPGKDYIKGKTDWKKLSYHDSCWRADGVNKFFWDNRNNLNSLDSNYIFSREWYKIVNVRELSEDMFKWLIMPSVKEIEGYNKESS